MEPAGYGVLADLSALHMLQLDACTSCGKCHEVCPAQASGPKCGAAMLDVQSVTVTFGGVHAVQDVSFRIDAECLGVVGANGAGKTTLLNAISGLAPLRSGHIVLDDEELSELAAARRARLGMGRSFQHPLLMEAMTM